MSARAERFTADYVAAVLRCLPSVHKSAGSADLLTAACGPLVEQIVTYERHILKSDKAAKRHGRQIKQINKTLAAIATPQASYGTVPYRPHEWETRLTPRRQPPKMNGAAFGGLTHVQEQAPPPGHPER